jgi:hypothetical protein
MKKQLITFSVASLLMGGLVGCAGDQQVQDTGREAQMIGQNDQNDQTYKGAGINGIGNRTNNLRIANTDDNENTNTGDNNENTNTENTAQEEEYTYGGSFEDVDGHWGEKEIEWAETVELFEGTGGNKFDPDKQLTRAEAATLFSRLHEIGVIAFPDDEGDETTNEEETTEETTNENEETTENENELNETDNNNTVQ